MKKLSIVLLVLISQISFAGNNREKTGNGGLGVVCRDPETQKITSAETLDLFEAKYQYGLKLRESYEDHTPVHNNYTPVREKLLILAPEFSKLFTLFELAIPSASMIEDKFSLTETADAGFNDESDEDPMPVIKDGCKIEQIAVYTLEEDAFIVKHAIWSKLDELNKSALRMHETIYLMDRKLNKAKDSKLTRKIVALLFSEEDDVTDYKIQKIINKNFKRLKYTKRLKAFIDSRK